MKTTLYLHIGYGKTATTTIQAFLRVNADMLEERGILWAEVLWKEYVSGTKRQMPMRYGTVALPWYLSRELIGDNRHTIGLPSVSVAYAELMNQVDVDLREFAEALVRCKGRYSKVVVSSEDFTCFPYALFFPTVISEEQNHSLRDSFILRCREYFSMFDDIKVIVSVRRQDQYIESGYNQVVSGPLGYRGTVDQLVDFHACALDYAGNLLAWAKHFGLQNILLTPFEPAAMPFGPLKVFLQNIDPDIEPSAYKSADIYANYSASAELLSNKLYYNRFVSDGLGVSQRDVMHAYFMEQIEIEKRSGVVLLTQEDRHQILNRFAASNDKTARTFLGEDYGALFKEPLMVGQEQRLPHLYCADLPLQWDIDLPTILSRPPKKQAKPRWHKARRWKKKLIKVFDRIT